MTTLYPSSHTSYVYETVQYVQGVILSVQNQIGPCNQPDKGTVAQFTSDRLDSIP